MKKKNNLNTSSIDVNENFNCVFVASAIFTKTIYPDYSFPFFVWSESILIELLHNIDDYTELQQGIIKFFSLLWCILAIPWAFFNILFLPVTLWPINVTFGELKIEYNYWSGENEYYWIPSKGWIWTNGSNGVIRWEGNLYGNLKRITWEYGHYGFLGVRDFRGIKIFNNL